MSWCGVKCKPVNYEEIDGFTQMDEIYVFY